MADFPIITETKKRVLPIQKELWLEQGEKLADKAAVDTVVNTTVPAGKKVLVSITVAVLEIEDM